MATIVTRAGKGSPLTHNEVDANFTNLNTDKIESGDTVASLTVTSADINGGTIDGTVIGGSTPAAGSFTTGSFSGNLTVDTNTLFVDAANNRVGVRTISPATQLEVVGTIRASGGGPRLSILDTGGATDEKEWSFSGSDGPLRLFAINEAGGGSGDYLDFTRVGNSVRTIRGARSGVTTYELSNFDRSLFFSGGVSTIGTATAHDLVVDTNNTERMRITSTGSVGIGTSSPAYELNVVTSGNTDIGIESGASSFASLFFGDSASKQDGQVKYNNSDQSMRFHTATTERMRITSTGSVGIGTSNPGTTRLMAVASSAYSAAIQATSDSSALNWARLDIRNTNAADPIILYQDQAGNGFLRNDTSTGMLAFQTAGSSERMRINSAGNVGIGTSSPQKALEVNGSSGELLRLSVTADGGTQQSFGIGFATGDTNTHPAALIEAEEFDASDSRADLVFSTRGTNGDAAPTEAMRILSNGTVGINTTTTQGMLDVHAVGEGGITALHLNKDSNTGYFLMAEYDGSVAPNRTYTLDPPSSDSASEPFTWSTGNSHAWKVDGTEAMRLDSSGNVGIGTSSPSSKLEVIEGDTDAVSIITDGHVQLYDNTSLTRSYTFLSRNPANSMVGGNIRLDSSVTTGSHVGYSNGTNQRGGSGIIFENTSEGAAEYGETIFLQSNDTNDDTWVVRETMRIDSSGIVDILGGTVELNGNELNGISVTIADDAVASITFPTRQGGFLFLTCEGQQGFPQLGFSYAGFVDFGNSPLGASPMFDGGTSMDLNNVDTPTGTTGTDGDCTIFLAGTVGTLYVENRTGVSRTWQVTLM